MEGRNLNMFSSPRHTVVRKVINTKTAPAKVDRVIINGVSRTKDDLLEKQVQDVMNASTMFEVMNSSHELRDKLAALGIFKRIGFVIDTSKAPGSDSTSYDLVFHVEERNFATGGIQTQVDQNSANVQYSIGVPNIFGRAEKVMAEYTYGSKQRRGIGVKFTKPINGNIDVMYGATGYQSHTEYPTNGFKETSRGISTDLSFLSLLGDHNMRWEGVWRDLRCLNNTASFAVREQAGHSLKSSLIHTFTRDLRDDRVFPSEGTLLKITQELAGLGGNAKFFKHDVEVQFNKELFSNTVLQMSLAGGVMRPLQKGQPVLINDRFFLGGPLTLRGFNYKGVGPQSDGNVLGGDAYAMGALHLYAPLLFRRYPGGFSDLFRSHFFINTGTCGCVSNIGLDGINRQSLKDMSSSLRLAYGVGIVFQLGMARLELNYTVPIWSQKGDSTQPGIQLGVGFNFL